MENGFTPGPWRVDAQYLSEVQTADSKSVASCWHEQCEGALITVNGVLDCSLGESAANARLIAAAPDLLAALIEMEAAFGTEFAGGPAVKARAAIAKARDMGEFHDDRGED